MTCSISNRVFIGDYIINMAQVSMKKKYRVTAHLQDTVLGPALNFNIVTEPFVQILHDPSLHWVAVTNLECGPGEVTLMDSLLKKCRRGSNDYRIHPNILDQICKLIRPKRNLVVRIESCDRQPNDADCGLYAIAFVQYVLQYNKFVLCF